MRRADIQQDTLFCPVIPEASAPKTHPLRPIRDMVNAALKALDADFNALYSAMGRDSIPPEKLLRAQLLMAFYTIRSERQLMEQINYILLSRWFVGFFDGQQCLESLRVSQEPEPPAGRSGFSSFLCPGVIPG